MPNHPKIKPLHEVLAKLPMPEGCRNVAKKWRCIEVPYCQDNDDMLYFFDKGIPVLVPKERGAMVHEKCGGDAIDFVTNPEWDSFPKPKIAFKAGWAGPGTEFEQDEYHQMITSFSDVAKRDEARKKRQVEDTQKRQQELAEEYKKKTAEEKEKGGADGASKGENEDASIPPAVNDDKNRDNFEKQRQKDILNLQFFHRVEKDSHPPIPNLSEFLIWPEILEDGAVCDNATRVSETGAVTWWHLDDGGEFVMQTGLPDKAHPDNKLPVKVFLYGPPNSYDWFMHDDNKEQVDGKISSLDIFNVTDECLPPQEYLPIISVAVLEAGGRPLISPPNIPHIVITCNKCVMIEQRRISNLFLDEVGYFIERVKHWKNDPIIYDYIKGTLQEDESFVHTLVGLLVKCFQNNTNAIMKKRAAGSLYAIAAFPVIFKMPKDARESLKSVLKSEEFKPVLTPEYIDKLCLHFDVTRTWWEPGEIFRITEELCCAVIYQQHSPVYGPIRPTKELASQDRLKMIHAVKNNTLDAFLAGTGGNQKDDLLDELF